MYGIFQPTIWLNYSGGVRKWDEMMEKESDEPTADYQDARNTVDAPSDIMDSYPPFTQDESGPEFFYFFESGRRAEDSSS